MAIVFKDRVEQRTSTTGLSNLTLTGNIAMRNRFQDVFSIGDELYYVIEDGNGAQWEVGKGTFTGSSTLSRDTVRANSSGTTTKITLSSNEHRVFAAPDSQYLNDVVAIAAGHVGVGGASQHPDATTGTSGFMSTSDKTKLDAINQAVGTTSNVTHNTLTTVGDVTVYSGTAKEMDLGDEVLEMSGTGLSSGGALSIGTPTTTYDISLGSGHIANPSADTYTAVSWSAITGTTPGGNGVRYVYINSGGTVTESASAPTAEDRRDKIYLGRVIVSSGTVIQAQSEPVIVEQATNQIYDLAKALRIFNESGNDLSANGANLSFDKSAGVLFSVGGNFQSNAQIPHSITVAATVPTTFQHITQTAATGTDVTVVDPANYDVAGTITAITGSANRSQNMRVYLFPSGNVRVAYGQVIYDTLTEAIQGLATETFVENPSIAGNGVLIGVIAITKGCTALNSTSNARFLRASRFGETSVGGSGASVSSFQNVYENSLQPQITTDSTRGAIQVKRGSAADTDNVIEVLNGAGTTTASIDGNGDADLAGLAVDTDTLYVDKSNNRVGIGTTSPLASMHISSTTPVIQLTDTNTGCDSQISADSSSGSLIIRVDENAENVNSSLLFFIDGTEKARITPDGELGVGTATPAATLDVNGIIKAKSYTVATLPTAIAGGVIYVSDETGGAVLAFSDGTNWRRVTDRAIAS